MSWDDGALDSAGSEFEDDGFNIEVYDDGQVLQLQTGEEADAFYHYIIPSQMWKENVVDREVEDGEYRYWNWAPWRMGISKYNSIREYVASCVKEVDCEIERGEVEEFDGGDGPE